MIDLMEEQRPYPISGINALGILPGCHVLKRGQRLRSLWQGFISERHRLRFEFNSKYRNLFEENGMPCVGEETRDRPC